MTKSTKSAVVATAEVSAVALLLGGLAGKAGGTVEVYGVPVNAIGAVALHGAAFLSNPLSAPAQHMHALGDGALGVYFSDWGRDTGRKWNPPLPPPLPRG